MASFAAIYCAVMAATIAQRCHVTGCADSPEARALCGGFVAAGAASLTASWLL